MKKSDLEGTTVTIGANGHEHTMSGETFAGLPERVAHGDLRRVAEGMQEKGEQDDAFARSVREETRSGPALPAAGGRPSWEQLAEAFGAERDAEARHAALKADLKERQQAFEEEVADLKESIKFAKEYHAAMLLALKGLGLQLKTGAR